MCKVTPKRIRKITAFQTLTPEISLIKNNKVFNKKDDKAQDLGKDPNLNDSSTVKLCELFYAILDGLSPHLSPLNIQSHEWLSHANALCKTPVK